MALVRNDGADVVRPVRFTAAAGRLLGLDWAAAAYADFPCGVSGVISARMPVALTEVGIRKPFALRRDITALRCGSGDHLYSLAETPRRTAALRHPAWHRLLRWAYIDKPGRSPPSGLGRRRVSALRLG